ncbi:hypothetical protein ACJX0J_028040, partial [Zea mays]
GLDDHIWMMEFTNLAKIIGSSASKQNNIILFSVIINLFAIELFAGVAYDAAKELTNGQDGGYEETRDELILLYLCLHPFISTFLLGFLFFKGKIEFLEKW